MFRKFLILVCLTLAAPTAIRAQDTTQQSKLPPLTDFIDASRDHFDTARFIGQFNSLCRRYGEEALDAALAPFKDPVKLNAAIGQVTENSSHHPGINAFLARIFWKGMCVEKDEAAAYSVMTDMAYEIALNLTKNTWEDLPEVKAFNVAQSSKSAGGRPEDVINRLFTDWDIPPWTERMMPIGDAARVFKPELIAPAAMDTVAEPSATNYQDSYYSPYLDIPPVAREVARAQKIAARGFDAPLEMAFTLRQEKIVRKGQNRLARMWLKMAAGEPFEHPYAFHLQALWSRDRVLSGLLAKESGEWDRTRNAFSRIWVDAYTSNKALSRALEVGDTSLLPLAYCLMDYQLWDESGESNLRRAGENYNNMFEGRDNPRADRLTFQYQAMLLMEEMGQKFPKARFDQVSDEISFLTRLGLKFSADMRTLDLDPKLLPEEAIDLTTCADATGQTAFWQEMGLLDAPEEYWLGADVARTAFEPHQ